MQTSDKRHPSTCHKVLFVCLMGCGLGSRKPHCILWACPKSGICLVMVVSYCFVYIIWIWDVFVRWVRSNDLTHWATRPALKIKYDCNRSITEHWNPMIGHIHICWDSLKILKIRSKLFTLTNLEIQVLILNPNPLFWPL
jgi:hypothetical protein